MQILLKKRHVRFYMSRDQIFFIRKYMIFSKKGGIYSGTLSIYMRSNSSNELTYVQSDYRFTQTSLIRRSVNLVSAVRIEGSNFNQWLSVIEIQTNFCLYLAGAKPSMSVFNSIKQLLCAKWSCLGLNTSNTLKNDTQARSIRGGLGGSIPLLGFSRFWVCFQMFIYILFGSRLFNESVPFHFQLSKNCWVA